ncbi:HAD family hydrolase [Maribacter sp. 2307ULW6-5]|uniref:HAD family hydrolase n=1 Tax=Maribacter sp. 2307ULW6-5 TaxID=3386275 RepID=UPI0039BCD98A
MKVKVICSDLDGTLLSTKSDVSQTTIDAVAHIKDHVRIILVSARMPSAMQYIQKDLGILDAPMICYNGALVCKNGKKVHSREIPPGTAVEVEALARDKEALLGLYHENGWYVPNTSERVTKEIKHTKVQPVYEPTKTTLHRWEQEQKGAHKIMVMATKGTADPLEDKLRSRFAHHLQIYRSNDTLLELSPKGTNKATAIAQLLEPGEHLANVLAFGDNYNDMEMLRQCGTGVAVHNAKKAVKEVADHITKSNTEHGVAHFIRTKLII